MPKKKKEDEQEPIEKDKETPFPWERVDGDGAAKSEAIREMFDFIPTKDKLKSRTRINLKQAHAFAMQRTILAMLDPNETRLAPEIYMDEYMTHVLSVDGKSRLEGMSIFQYQQEEKDMGDSIAMG